MLNASFSPFQWSHKNMLSPFENSRNINYENQILHGQIPGPRVKLRGNSYKIHCTVHMYISSYCTISTENLGKNHSISYGKSNS